MKFTFKYPDAPGLFLDGITGFSRDAGKRSTTVYLSQPVESNTQCENSAWSIRVKHLQNFVNVYTKRNKGNTTV